MSWMGSTGFDVLVSHFMFSIRSSTLMIFLQKLFYLLDCKRSKVHQKSHKLMSQVPPFQGSGIGHSRLFTTAYYSPLYLTHGLFQNPMLLFLLPFHPGLSLALTDRRVSTSTKATPQVYSLFQNQLVKYISTNISKLMCLAIGLWPIAAQFA